MEKFPKVDMDAATTGVDSEDPDYYDIERRQVGHAGHQLR